VILQLCAAFHELAQGDLLGARRLAKPRIGLLPPVSGDEKGVDGIVFGAQPAELG
jgi:hypothetical protein